MAEPFTRDYIKEWIKRKLGSPIVEVELDDDQLEDCIDDALDEVAPWVVQRQYITLPASQCIDLSEYKVAYVINVHKADGATDSVDQLDVFNFSTRLFKRLIAPSMRFGKVVNDVRSTKMRKLLIALSHSNDEVNSILNTPWIVKGESEQAMLRTGLNQDLVYSPPWKRLACKLVEFLLSDKKCTKELGRRLFSLGYDVEHIQSYTDEADRERIWKEWDWELNGLGNLAMLEYSLNRSIQNDTSKKLSAYRQSKFKSIEKIVPEM